MSSKSGNFSRIIVRSSPIHGRGMFAVRALRKGEIVVTWENTREISPEEHAALSIEERHYVDMQYGKILLVGEPERFVNHSCDANTVPGDRCDIANRDIAEGDEITADYSHFFIPTGQFECKCGSVTCRHLVKGRQVE